MIQDPRKNTGRHQNVIDWFLGHAPPLQKIHQNPFITSGDILFTRNNYHHHHQFILRQKINIQIVLGDY